MSIRDQKFYAAFRPCGCLSSCVPITYTNAQDVTTRWIQKGFTVVTLTGAEIIDSQWGCSKSEDIEHHRIINQETL